MWNWRCKVAFEQDLSIGDVFNGKTYPDVPLSPKSTPQSMKFYNPVCQTPNTVIHGLNQEILNFCMQMLGCKIALERDLSIGAIFRLNKYSDVPLILSTRPNGLNLDL
jgi:hypothetical protein